MGTQCMFCLRNKKTINTLISSIVSSFCLFCTFFRTPVFGKCRVSILSYSFFIKTAGYNKEECLF